MNMQEAKEQVAREKAEREKAQAEQEQAKREASEIQNLRGEIVSLEWLLANPSFAPCKENAELVKKYFSQEGHTEWSSATISKIFADHRTEFRSVEAPKPEVKEEPRRWSHLTKALIASMDREEYRNNYRNDPEFKEAVNRVMSGRTPYKEVRQ